MTQTAIVRDGTVINIIEADPAEVKNLPDGDSAVAVKSGAAIGGTYAGGVFARPADPPPLPPPPKRVFTPNEFLDRLSAAKQDALIALGTSADPAARKWYARFVGARSLSIDDPRFAAGLDFLVAQGVLTPAERDELLQPA